MLYLSMFITLNFVLFFYQIWTLFQVYGLGRCCWRYRLQSHPHNLAEEIWRCKTEKLKSIQICVNLFYYFQPDDDVEAAEKGETEKLNLDSKMRDASTSMSLERLSLMIKFNQVGSMSSLSRSKVSEKFRLNLWPSSWKDFRKENEK